jgi:hypothetical protein
MAVPSSHVAAAFDSPSPAARPASQAMENYRTGSALDPCSGEGVALGEYVARGAQALSEP